MRRGRPLRGRVWGLALALLLGLGCGPIGPFPGGPLTGNEVTDPVDDWSFASRRQEIQLETRPESPYSVNVWCIVRDGALYVPSGRPEGKRWVMEEAERRARAKRDAERGT